MPLFRKRPIEVEAVQFTGENWNEIQRFVGFRKDGNGWDIMCFNPIRTYSTSDDSEIVAEVWDKLHSSWVGVKEGQWIIRGTEGEFYPCDDNVFRKTYDPAEPYSLHTCKRVNCGLSFVRVGDLHEHISRDHI